MKNTPLNKMQVDSKLQQRCSFFHKIGQKHGEQTYTQQHNFHACHQFNGDS